MRYETARLEKKLNMAFVHLSAILDNEWSIDFLLHLIKTFLDFWRKWNVRKIQGLLRLEFYVQFIFFRMNIALTNNFWRITMTIPNTSLNISLIAVARGRFIPFSMVFVQKIWSKVSDFSFRAVIHYSHLHIRNLTFQKKKINHIILRF